MRIEPYGGWARCAWMEAGDLELVVTQEVGPRIIRFGRKGGPNELVEYERHGGLVGGGEYRSYGGHRLWTAPEDRQRTYEADNDPVEIFQHEGWTGFRTPHSEAGLQKTILVRPDPTHPRFLLDHWVHNTSDRPQTIAPWCLTVMAAGGTCLFPQHEPRSHEDALLPARPLVMWHYTRMQDPRWTWGDRVVRLRHDPEGDPQKVGAAITQGYAAYANHGNLFLKRFPFDSAATYPDLGCNFETFTRHDMLEVESLGALVTLQPGETASHRETWYLIPDAEPPADDRACGDWLERLVAERPLS